MVSRGLFASVVNYCEYEEASNCIDAIVAAGIPAEKIIIVDNASPDGSGHRLQERFPACQMLYSTENVGYGQGHNLAIEFLMVEREDEFELVLIVNPDVRVTSGALEELTRVIEDRPCLAGVSPVQWQSKDFDRLDSIFESWFQAQGGQLGNIGRKTFVSTRSLLGAAMLLTREALAKVGGFDPLYFLYGEEEDLARRFRYHGFQLGVATRSFVVHGRPYQSENGRERGFQRRSSHYLYLLKDPFAPVPYNLVRVLIRAIRNMGACIVKRNRHVGGWLRELRWFVSRVGRGCKHRNSEMDGAAHLEKAS